MVGEILRAHRLEVALFVLVKEARDVVQAEHDVGVGILLRRRHHLSEELSVDALGFLTTRLRELFADVTQVSELVLNRRDALNLCPVLRFQVAHLLLHLHLAHSKIASVLAEIVAALLDLPNSLRQP